MIEKRSGSQILFGFLPEQTVDLQGGIWKVKEWRNPEPTRAIEMESLRRELIRQAGPWAALGTDGKYVDNLRKGYEVCVYRLNMEAGVSVESYPRIRICQACDRVWNGPRDKCQCGATRFVQLPFVGYHEKCGAVCEPYIQVCPQHKQVKMVQRGSAKLEEILFQCPTCQKIIQKGVGFRACTTCNSGNFVFQVHRAASVYTPRSLVMINPPSTPGVKRLHEVGGPARALSWVLSGLIGATVDEQDTTRESLRAQLLAQRLSPALVEQFVEQAIASGEVLGGQAPVDLLGSQRQQAEEGAVRIAHALSQSRIRVEDMVLAVDSASELAATYSVNYLRMFGRAGLETIELVDKFPVFTGCFGYTRGNPTPGVSRLVQYKNRKGEYVVYGEIAETEALFIRLRPTMVATWLHSRGHQLDSWTDERTARIALLRAVVIPQAGENPGSRSVGEVLLTLVHSYAHWVIRRLAVHAGIDRNALSELLIPEHSAFFVYAANRGDFVLGGLQALFETELDIFLRDLVSSDLRCPLDPGCERVKGACMACLHLGEPSCRYFNSFLGRSVLGGESGYVTSVIRASALQA